MTRETLQRLFDAAQDEPQWHIEERQRNLHALIRDGFPTRRDEGWKYTRSEPFTDFLQTAPKPSSLNENVIASSLTALGHGTNEWQLVFANGLYCESFSKIPDGVHIAPRDSGDATDSGGTEAAMARLVRALAGSDLMLSVDAGVRVDRPIHLIHICAPGQLSQVSLQVISGDASAVKLVEHFVASDTSDRLLSNVWWRVELGKRAVVSLHRHQQLPTNALQATRIDANINADAALTTFTLDTGAALARNDLNVRLQQPGARVDMKGLYLVNDKQHVDNHTRVDHVARDTISREDYRGILRDSSRAVFNGKVVVHKGADGTDSSQSNPNLLLSDNAEIDTKPELEIYADDVKCAHGATVGQIDRQALFYLQSRAVDERVATQLLTYAFCRETLLHVEEASVRRMAEQLIASQIPEFTALDIIE